ncbi:hypothetical protein KI387_011906 [Taxus chinensis]|uniref:Uncharacterized protein n=1 Tax=Taxus chinensis TaxID=29808 RepID=A0AA38FF76_TAXCH|nr:hypothetical protein KI387_011906 [Taxus chinensis]
MRWTPTTGEQMTLMSCFTCTERTTIMIHFLACKPDSDLATLPFFFYSAYNTRLLLHIPSTGIKQTGCLATTPYPFQSRTAIPTMNPSHINLINTVNNNVRTLVPYLRLPTSRKPKINNVIRARLVELKATRKVSIPFKQQGGASTGGDYIKQVDRIVKITFPDSSRIKYLGDNVWQARLKPVTFFTITAISSCDVKVFHSRNSLQLSSNKLVLDLTGLPGLNDDLDFNFSLQGKLSVHKESFSVVESQHTHSFKGWVAMQINVDLPLPFALMPDSIILPVGNGILDRILGAMEGELTSRILRDYNIWCFKVFSQLTDTVPQALVP